MADGVTLSVRAPSWYRKYSGSGRRTNICHTGTEFEQTTSHDTPVSLDPSCLRGNYYGQGNDRGAYTDFHQSYTVRAEVSGRICSLMPHVPHILARMGATRFRMLYHNITDRGMVRSYKRRSVVSRSLDLYSSKYSLLDIHNIDLPYPTSQTYQTK